MQFSKDFQILYQEFFFSVKYLSLYPVSALTQQVILGHPINKLGVVAKVIGWNAGKSKER